MIKSIYSSYKNYNNPTPIGSVIETPSFPEPFVYDDMSNKDNIKISERFPKFSYGDLLDDILEEFGGVLEILKCEWDENTNEGTVACLMKDWRVFDYCLKQHEFASLNRDERISKINRECKIHEDIDDWSKWKESAFSREEQDKRLMQEKVEMEKKTVYGEKMKNALSNFFNGDVTEISKIMSSNTTSSI